jgi:hypothetical protein
LSIPVANHSANDAVRPSVPYDPVSDLSSLNKNVVLVLFFRILSLLLFPFQVKLGTFNGDSVFQSADAQMFLPGQYLELRQNGTLSSSHWYQITQDERQEYLRLRTAFRDQNKLSKDHRTRTFSEELHMLLEFIERSRDGGEGRSIILGLAFAGQYICVNTRQMSHLFGRCKSTINGCFQQIGYISMKTKWMECVAAVLPSLAGDPSSLRQWTARYASEEAAFCFLSRLPAPEIVLETFPDPELPTPVKLVKPLPMPMIGSSALVPVDPPRLLDDLDFWEDRALQADESSTKWEPGNLSTEAPLSESVVIQVPPEWFL